MQRTGPVHVRLLRDLYRPIFTRRVDDGSFLEIRHAGRLILSD